MVWTKRSFPELKTFGPRSLGTCDVTHQGQDIALDEQDGRRFRMLVELQISPHQ